MSSDLKKLVNDLETLVERGDLLDAPAREALITQIESLKRAIDDADAVTLQRLIAEALSIFANLLSVITNVMTLLK